MNPNRYSDIKNSNYLCGRVVVYQGRVQRNETGQYSISLPDGYTYRLNLTNSSLTLENYLNKQVQVRGNLTSEPGLINVSNIIAF